MLDHSEPEQHAGDWKRGGVYKYCCSVVPRTSISNPSQYGADRRHNRKRNNQQCGDNQGLVLPDAWRVEHHRRHYRDSGTRNSREATEGGADYETSFVDLHGVRLLRVKPPLQVTSIIARPSKAASTIMNMAAVTLLSGPAKGIPIRMNVLCS